MWLWFLGIVTTCNIVHVLWLWKRDAETVFLWMCSIANVFEYCWQRCPVVYAGCWDCVFSCSWRFTFYLLAFIAGLAALIDVSIILSSPLLPPSILPSLSAFICSGLFLLAFRTSEMCPSTLRSTNSCLNLYEVHIWSHTLSLPTETLALWRKGNVGRIPDIGVWVVIQYGDLCPYSPSMYMKWISCTRSLFQYVLMLREPV